MPPGRTIAALALGVMVGAAALAGCSGGGTDEAGDEPLATATTEVEPSSTTTTSAPETTTTLAQDQAALLSSTPPPLATAGEDFPAIVQSMVFYMEWVGFHPDPARVKEVYIENGPGWSGAVAYVQDLVDRGLANRGDPSTTSDVRVLNRLADDRVLLYTVITVPPYTYVDAGGQTVQSDEGRPAAGWSYELARDPSGRWFVVDRTDLGVLPQ